MGAPNGRRRSFSESLIFYGAVFLALLSLYDPIKDIYTRWMLPEIGDEPIEVALQQQKLTEKNLDCLIGANPQEVPLNEKVRVRLLACDTGDIQVAVYPENAPAKLRWITPHVPETRTANLTKLGAGALLTMEPAPRPFSPAQANIANVCSAWEDPGRKARLIRITNEGGQCWKEIVNVFTGRIDYREKAECNAPCAPVR
ncbi:MAG: hypothetical protein NW215_12865 [Hyphomicrobiales bacterium]|nr:hypothetical protein [Hyphomicrobiales bacterium]